MFEKKFEMKNTESYKAYLKSPYLSTKHSTYFKVYDELFRRYKDKKITFVEIGILGGGRYSCGESFLALTLESSV